MCMRRERRFTQCSVAPSLNRPPQAPAVPLTRPFRAEIKEKINFFKIFYIFYLPNETKRCIIAPHPTGNDGLQEWLGSSVGRAAD